MDETVGDMTTAEAVIVLAERKANAVAPGFPVGAVVLACDSMLERLDGLLGEAAIWRLTSSMSGALGGSRRSTLDGAPAYLIDDAIVGICA